MWLWLTFAAVAAGAFADLVAGPNLGGLPSSIRASHFTVKLLRLCPAHGRARAADQQSAEGSFAKCGTSRIASAFRPWAAAV